MLAQIYRRSPPWLRSYGRARTRYGAVLAHPDGQRLIAAEYDGTVTVWGLADQRLPAMLSSYELEDARGVDLVLHPDGVRLFATVVIVDTSDVTHCWNLETGELIDRYQYPRVPHAFVGERWAVTAHGLYLTLWDLDSGETIRELFRDDASWRLFGTIGEHALTSGGRGAELWHLREGRVRWSVTSSEARGAAIAGDAVLLAAPGRLELRAVDGAVIRRLDCPVLAGGDDWTVRVDRAVTTTVIAGATDDLIAIDLATGAVRSRFPRSNEYVDVAIAATERDAIVWSSVERIGAVWSLATGACRLRAPGELVLAPDGNTAIMIDGAHLRLWPVDDRDFSAVEPAWTAITVGSDAIVALDRAHQIHVVERSGAPRRVWDLATTTWQLALAGDRIAFAEADAIAVLDALTGTRVSTIAAIGPTSIILGPDIVAATTRTGEIRIWRTTDATLLASFSTRVRAPDVLALEPDGRRVAVRADNTVELWRTQPAQRVHTFRSLTRPWCAAFDPGRRWLVSGHEDGALLVRDTLARTHHLTLQTDAGVVRAVAARNARVAACGADGGITVWDLESGARLGAWSGDDDVLDLAWLDDDTLACAGEGGLVLLRLS